MCDLVAATAFCPYCQMPFKLIRQKDVNLHIEVCGCKQTNHENIEECPKGLKCDSTMMCHYERYSHILLATRRAQAYNHPLKAETEVPTVLLAVDEYESDCSVEDFRSDLSTPDKNHRKFQRMKNHSKRKKSALSKDKSPINKKQLLASNIYHKISTGKQSDHTDPNFEISNSVECCESSSSLFEYESEGEPSDSGGEQLVLPSKGPGFVLKMPNQIDTKDCGVDTETSSASYSGLSLKSQNGKSGHNSSTVNATSLTGSFNKQKQCDIGHMLFGLKPLRATHSTIQSNTVEGNLQAKDEVIHKQNFNKRSCPFYKKIHGTNIAVDAFSYGVIPGIQFYFLSHFHYDHYMGLTKKFPANVYCSSVTGNLVEMRLGFPNQQVKRLDLNKTINIGEVDVTLLEANHCPGAVLMLFKLANGQIILHTGDFRADKTLQSNIVFSGLHVNILYLDTTYMDPSYSFPSQNDVVDYVCHKIQDIVQCQPKTLVVTGTYCIGKEKIFLGIAKTLKCLVCVKRDKSKILRCLKDEDVDKVLTNDRNVTLLHVLPMNDLSVKKLQEYLNSFNGKFKQIVAVKPTGWTYKGQNTELKDLQPSVHGAVVIYGVPYSEHSSFVELKQFVELLKPDRVIPTVNVGKPESRQLMESYLKVWKKR